MKSVIKRPLPTGDAKADKAIMNTNESLNALQDKLDLTENRIVRTDEDGELDTIDEMTASRVMITDADGMPDTGSITTTHLNYLPYISPISVAKSGNYVVTDTDGYGTILMTTGASNYTVTLPTVADNIDRVIQICKVDSGAGTVLVDGEGAETIDGLTTRTIFNQYGKIKIKATSTEWIVIEINNIWISDTDDQLRTQAAPAANTWYQQAGVNLTIALPIGIYEIHCAAVIQAQLSSAAGNSAYLGAQLDTNAVTPGTGLLYREYKSQPGGFTATEAIVHDIRIHTIPLTFAAAASVYLSTRWQVRVNVPTVSNSYIRGDMTPCYLWAKLVG